MQEPLHSMVNGQIKPNKVTDPRVIEAFEAIPRAAFVPEGLKEVAYVDEDLEVAPGRYVIEPMILAKLISAAKIQSSDVVLDVGCGTGYTSAILSKLANVVVGIEEDPALVEEASEILAGLQIENVAIIQRALKTGCQKQGPFNVILITGGVQFIPDIYLGQLADGGRLVTVMQTGGVGRGHLVTRTGDTFGHRDLFDAHVPPLPGFQKEKTFQF